MRHVTDLRMFHATNGKKSLPIPALVAAGLVCSFLH